ncbi:MAG: glycoside hydrolase family 99-like domain-containing protein, partial [Pirellulales bacterium]|nr:glycoside hydrolase family 99-like domain-containing protein [Pirellulales bacterium]
MISHVKTKNNLFPAFMALAFFFCIPAQSVIAGDKVLAEWRFDRDGDLRGWSVGGNLKDVAVSGGALRGEATGSDPIIFGPMFEIPAALSQCIEIKIKCDEDSTGQIYWTNTTQGKYNGFAAERCNNLDFRGDGRFHVYRVEPFWHSLGKIIRLRFDPPNKGRFEVEWIRIIETKHESTQSPAASTAKAWKFDKQMHGWLIRPGTAKASIVDGMLRLLPQKSNNTDIISDGEWGTSPALVSPQLSFSADENGIVSVRMAVDAKRTDLSGRIMCVSKTLFGFSQATFPLRVDGKMHTYNIDMKTLQNWRDEIIMIALRLPDFEDAEYKIESIHVGPNPSGPVELAIDYFGPTEGVNRANRSVHVTCAARNLGGQTAKGATMTLSVPPGVKILDGARRQIVLITCYLPKQASWSIEAPRPGPVEIAVKVDASEADSMSATAKATVHFTPAPQVDKCDHVPEPQPVKSKYEVGVFYFPGWPTMDRWRPILDYPLRKPVLGWYDEANPECVDWQIKWAVEHGVRFFMVDWYWDKGRRHLEHWLHDGFKNARHRRYLKWAVMWANHNRPGSHSKEDWREVTQYWIDNYFGTDEYYKIDGRPVVFIWAPGNIRNDLGGSSKAAELYAMSRSMAKAAGHKGIYFAAMSSNGSTDQCRQLKEEGYEAMTNYHGFQLAHQEAGSRRFPYADVVRTGPEVWRRADECSGNLTYLPIVDTGWSSEPWHHGRALVIHDRTPELFGQLCRKAREFADKTGKKIIALGPWNEWGEGSYIEPYAQYGFGDLEQLRAAFCEPGDYPPNLIPS